MKNVIYCHKDNDGHVAGYWCELWLSYERYKVKNVIIPINYNEPVDFSDITSDDFVFIVDFSFEPETMKSLLEKTRNVIWIDHHISAIDKYKKYDEENNISPADSMLNTVSGVRYSGIAGCALTWYYLFGQYDEQDEFIRIDQDGDILDPNKTVILSFSEDYDVAKHRADVYEDMPKANMHIADNDIWEFEHPDTKDFISGLGFLDCYTHEGRMHISRIMNSPAEYDKILESGRTLTRYKTNELYPRMCQASHECKIICDDERISNAKCVALNMPFCFNSDVFASIKEPYDIYIKFSVNPNGGWNYTFYSKNNSSIDAVDVAKYFGGGGHKQAAGAMSENLIFEWVK